MDVFLCVCERRGTTEVLRKGYQERIKESGWESMYKLGPSGTTVRMNKSYEKKGRKGKTLEKFRSIDRTTGVQERGYCQQGEQDSRSGSRSKKEKKEKEKKKRGDERANF